MPTKKLLEPYPRLLELFLPLAQCIRRGDLRAFDEALIRGEDEFVKRRIYLTLERSRDIALRNLLRKVFLVGGFEDGKDGSNGEPKVRRTRVPLAEFQAAISMNSGGDTVDPDEVECLIANMIYKVSDGNILSVPADNWQSSSHDMSHQAHDHHRPPRSHCISGLAALCILWVIGRKCAHDPCLANLSPSTIGLLKSPTMMTSHVQPSVESLTLSDQDLMKGYISREHGKIVLSKKGAFPGTGV